MDADRIVRAVAALDPVAPVDDAGNWACSFCGTELITAGETAAFAGSDHADSCPWWLAKQWAAANPAR